MSWGAQIRKGLTNKCNNNMKVTYNAASRAFVSILACSSSRLDPTAAWNCAALPWRPCWPIDMWGAGQVLITVSKIDWNKHFSMQINIYSQTHLLVIHSTHPDYAVTLVIEYESSEARIMKSQKKKVIFLLQSKNIIIFNLFLPVKWLYITIETNCKHFKSTWCIKPWWIHVAI